MPSCPREPQLQQFLDEQLADGAAQIVASHITDCARCQLVLERLTDEGAGGEPALALAHARTTALQTPPPDFLARLRVVPPEAGDQSAALPIAASTAATTIPGYTILRELGRGGMGIVYQARHLKLNRLVALKMVRFGPNAPAKELLRIRQEAEAVAQLHHPNIVQIYDIGDTGGLPYLALEYVAGGSLLQHLRGDPQPAYPAARLIETIARAVQFAHEHGIVHRDLKPANILLAAGNASPTEAKEYGPLATVPKIADFGLAKRLDDQANSADGGELAGTPSYMAPEQAASRGQPVGPGADIYALGAILYETLTGRPPFKGPTALDTVLQVLNDEPVPPAHLRPNLPRDLETICLKCLAKDARRRYASAADLAEDLRRFRHGAPIQARPISPLERAWKWAGRQPGHAALALGLVAVTILGFLGVTWQWREAAVARDAALAEKVEKEIQREQADAARAAAEVAQQHEADQRRQARQSLYYSRIAQCELQWRVNDFLSAGRSLADCLPRPGILDRRGWEWYYLRGLLASDLCTLRHRAEGLTGSVDVSADGRWIASVQGGHAAVHGGKSAELRIWDARTGAVAQAWTVAPTFHRLVFHPDSRRLVLAGTDGRALIRDGERGTDLLQCRPHTGAIAAAVFSPDGQNVASAGWDGVAQVWDAQTGVIRQTLRGHTGRLYDLACHADGRIATAGADGTVRLWNSRTGGLLSILRGHPGPVYGVAFSPDGKLLVSAGATGTLKIWDLASERVTQSLTGQTGAVLTVVFSPDSRYLAYAGSDTTVRVWDIEAGVEQCTLRGHTAAVDAVQFTPDGQRLVSGSAGQAVVKVWDLTRHPEFATLARTSADIEALVYRRADQQLVSVSVGGRLQVWDAASGVLQEERDLPLSEEVLSPAVLASFSPDGARLVARGRADGGRVARVWDVSSGDEVLELRGHEVPLTCVRCSADGRCIATGGCDLRLAGRPREIKVWEARSGKQLADLAGTGPVVNLLFAPDSRYLAIADDAGSVTVLDWAGARVVFQAAAHQGSVSGLAFSPDGRRLATAGLNDRKVLLWDLRVPAPAPTPLVTILAPPACCDLAFSPDGSRLAGASRNLVKLWDAETGQAVLTLRGAPPRHFDPVFNPRLLWDASGSQLAASNWDESISVWAAPRFRDGEVPEQGQALQRQRTEERATFWHLQEAEQCLKNRNLSAARFHLQRLTGLHLPVPLHNRRNALLTKFEREASTSESPK